MWLLGSGQPKNKSAVSVYMEGRGKRGGGRASMIPSSGSKEILDNELLRQIWDLLL